MTHNKQTINAMEIEEVAGLGSCGLIRYQMTLGEQIWLDHVRGHYSIATYLDSVDNEGIVLIDTIDASKAMDDDNGGVGKAAMLSDNSTLQRILWANYITN